MSIDCACVDEGVSANPLTKGLFPLNLLRPALRNYIFRENARAKVMARARLVPESFASTGLTGTCNFPFSSLPAAFIASLMVTLPAVN